MKFHSTAFTSKFRKVIHDRAKFQCLW